MVRRARPDISLYAGIFILSLALLAFEILSVRTLSFVLGSGYIYFTIALAMFGLSTAASLMSFKRFTPDNDTRSLVLLIACLVLAGLLVATYWGSATVKADLNATLRDAGASGGLQAVVAVSNRANFAAAIKLGAALSLPYLAFGFIITYLFSTIPAKLYGRIYAADLVGGAVGCVVAFVAMEKLAFTTSLLVPAGLSLAAAAIFASGASRRIAGGGLVAVAVAAAAFGLVGQTGRLEPRPGLHILARDYAIKRPVAELWRGWNSFSRVGALGLGDGGDAVMGVMALGNGEGHATLVPYRPDADNDWDYTPARLATALGVPDDALVLFAGAGADMIAIDRRAGGRSRITGVEINHTLVDGALGLQGMNLGAFLARPGINLVRAEGRAFLQRDKGRYDVILLSWSGTTISYYAGSLGPTTQFVFTRQGFEAIIDHLKPGGLAVILQVNKVNALATLRQIMDDRGLGQPDRAAVVLYRPGGADADWRLPWDNNPLLFKPDGFSAADMARLRERLLGKPWQIAYAPDEAAGDGVWPYRKVLTAPDAGRALASLGAPLGIAFGVPTDDRPFYLDIFPTARYFDGAFWSAVAGGTTTRPYELFRAARVMFVGLLAIAALLVILGPMLFHRGAGLASFGFSHIGFFAALGTGFMFLEIGFMHKLSLLFGNPGLSIAIVLAAFILFTGLGSLNSARRPSSGRHFRPPVLGIVVYSAFYLLINDAAIGWALGWPMAAKAALVIVLLAPVGLLLGRLFPLGLALVRAENRHLVPWAWAINGATGTIAAGLAPLIAQAIGFNRLILLGAALYATILLIPRYRAEAPLPLAAQGLPAE